MKPRAPRRHAARSEAQASASTECRLPPRRRRTTGRQDDRLLLSNLPKRIAVTREELDLLDTWFSDLINAALRKAT
jgi:hypothetical protein